MTTEATSRSPTLAELLRIAIDSHTRDLWTAIPGKIDKYDAEKQIADVKPLVQDLVATEDGEELAESLPIIPNVPVRFPRAGGFYITLPVAPGDFCLLIFTARSIDKYLEGSGNDTNPGDFRTHDLTDAIAFMGVAPFSSALSEDGVDSNLVLGKEGGVSIQIKGDGTIHLGSSDAADALALASKTEQEIDKVRNVLNTHIHTGTATVGPSAIVGVIAPPTAQAGPVGKVGSTVVMSD